jgi:hypothetical protein
MLYRIICDSMNATNSAVFRLRSRCRVVSPIPNSSMIRRDAFSVSGYNREAVEFAVSLALSRVQEAGKSYGIVVQTEQIK